jgi:hypothetical protein
MALSCVFAVVKISPDPLRDEAMNAAIVIFLPEGLDVHVTPSPERLRAIAPNLNSHALHELTKSLEALDRVDLPPLQRIEELRRLPGVTISDPGTLHGQNDTELRANIDALSERLLNAVRRPRSALALPKTSPLTTELTRIFRNERLLG